MTLENLLAAARDKMKQDNCNALDIAESLGVVPHAMSLWMLRGNPRALTVANLTAIWEWVGVGPTRASDIGL